MKYRITDTNGRTTYVHEESSALAIGFYKAATGGHVRTIMHVPDLELDGLPMGILAEVMSYIEAACLREIEHLDDKLKETSESCKNGWFVPTKLKQIDNLLDQRNRVKKLMRDSLLFRAQQLEN